MWKLVWKEILDFFIKTKLRRKCMHEIYLRCSQFLLFCISKCAFHLSQFNTHLVVVKLNKYDKNYLTPSLNQEFLFKAGVEVAVWCICRDCKTTFKSCWIWNVSLSLFGLSVVISCTCWGDSESEHLTQFSIQTSGAMTSPSSTQNDIACLIDCLSAKDDGSKAQQALSSILGIDVPLDAAVDQKSTKRSTSYLPHLSKRPKNTSVWPWFT